MKVYTAPEINISKFDCENIVTLSMATIIGESLSGDVYYDSVSYNTVADILSMN